jgi:hypothetical protein
VCWYIKGVRRKQCVVRLNAYSTVESASFIQAAPALRLIRRKNMAESHLLSRKASSDDSVNLNEFDTTFEENEAQGISLLMQIFPDESTDELRRLHRARVGQYSQLQPHQRQHLRFNTNNTVDESLKRLDNLGESALNQHVQCLRQLSNNQQEEFYYDSSGFTTRAIYRNVTVGLGLTLYEHDGLVRVYSTTSNDGRTWTSVPPKEQQVDGPALSAGVIPGSVLIGVNGTALLATIGGANESSVRRAVQQIQESPDPVVLHLDVYREQATLESSSGCKTPPPIKTIQVKSITPSLLDTSDFLNESREEALLPPDEKVFHSTPLLDGRLLVHPFIALLRSKGLIKSFEDERSNTEMWNQITNRTCMWEETSCLQVGPEIFVPLVGVRKALSVRILNTFLDGNDSAYTIWVYDVEACREWYAPIRYFRDFSDLRSAIIRLYPLIGQLPFPKPALSIFGSPVRNESVSERETKCHELENFLRTLCAMIYRGRLHSAIGEIAFFVQSFLGCDQALGDDHDAGHDDKSHVREMLKRSMQRYTYRLFLLSGVRSFVDNFIASSRAGGPRLEDLELLEAQGRAVLKSRAMRDLDRMKGFLDRLQEYIIEGCMSDFRSIASRDDYKSIHSSIHGDKGDVYWDRLVREAVREQIEIEVYVPLRGIVSRWLVNGWRHEDMEVSFKMKELRKRPQTMFRIPEELKSPSCWSTVCSILKEGVGLSTLPCAKLRSIVEAASEISALIVSEHKSGDADESVLSERSHVGADDFLPIFIYCVVQAEMERPCALCVLLRTLCDPISGMGEVGYYVASFEAAITHIQEVDLTAERDDIVTSSSFLSIALD